MPDNDGGAVVDDVEANVEDVEVEDVNEYLERAKAQSANAHVIEPGDVDDGDTQVADGEDDSSSKAEPDPTGDPAKLVLEAVRVGMSPDEIEAADDLGAALSAFKEKQERFKELDEWARANGYVKAGSKDSSEGESAEESEDSKPAEDESFKKYLDEIPFSDLELSEDFDEDAKKAFEQSHATASVLREHVAKAKAQIDQQMQSMRAMQEELFIQQFENWSSRHADVLGDGDRFTLDDEHLDRRQKVVSKAIEIAEGHMPNAKHFKEALDALGLKPSQNAADNQPRTKRGTFASRPRSANVKAKSGYDAAISTARKFIRG